MDKNKIKELRELTGMPILDCKNALAKHNYDFEKAKEEILSKSKNKFLQRNLKKSTSEGITVASYKKNFGVIFSLKCETDFVAKTKEFISTVEMIKNVALERKIKNIDEFKNFNSSNKGTIYDELITLSSKIWWKNWNSRF